MITRYEILSMPAGQELDEFVAVKLFGWRWPKNRCPVCGWPYAESVNEGCVPGNCSMRPRMNVVAITKRFPEYSMDIAAAWTIINGMIARHKRPKLSFVAEREWLCSMGHLEPEAYADTAPLAICRAALLTMLEDEVNHE